MKVLLLHPHPAGPNRISTPIGMGCVGALLKREGHEVRVLDELLPDTPTFGSVLRDFSPDVVGISCLSAEYLTTKARAKEVKDYRNIPVVVGGVHPSILPKYTLEDCKDIDYAIKGEGEYSFRDLLKSGSPVNIPGVFYRTSTGIEGINPTCYIENLDDIPSCWEVMDPIAYISNRPSGMVTRHREIANLLTSRGCPYGCTFCCASVVQGKKVRERSIKVVVDEVEYLLGKGIKELQIVDDNFTFNTEHVVGFCDEIKRRGLKFDWTCPNGIRADRLNKEVLTKMKDAGCYYFSVGVEVGSQRMMKEICKSLSLDKVKDTITIADKMGFITQGFFMLGFPTETREEMEETVRVACNLRLDRASVNMVMFLPGSKLFNSKFSEKDLNDLSWNELSCVKTWKPIPGVPDYTTVKKAIRHMRRKFYLNPVRAIRHISKVRTFHQAMSMVRGLREVSS